MTPVGTGGRGEAGVLIGVPEDIPSTAQLLPPLLTECSNQFVPDFPVLGDQN